jgi:predicted component of type VI protein secretion system
MLSDIHSYEDQTTLIMGSGVQFLDFAATFIVKGKSGALPLGMDEYTWTNIAQQYRSFLDQLAAKSLSGRWGAW